MAARLTAATTPAIPSPSVTTGSGRQRFDEPAVIGLSCYVWNFRQHMKIARLCKDRFPGCLTVAGGPHVPDHPAEFLRQHPYIDLAVHGEGEQAFTAILRERLSPWPDWFCHPRNQLPARRRACLHRGTPELDLGKHLDSAYLSGYLDPAIEVFKQQNVNFYAPWETNRGCPTPARSVTGDRPP